MPRKLSRIQLEVVNVRLERVQDITEEDAKAEGVEPNDPDNPDDGEYIKYPLCDKYGVVIEGFPAFSARESFQSLWEMINKKRGFGWEENPWCWVIEFRML